MSMETARHQMVQQQVRTSDVFDSAVLNTFRQLRRDRFAPEEYAHVAYAETEIPIGHGQTMCTPSLEGRMLQSLGLGKDDDVLEIGTGSGYLTACLGMLSGSVISVDLYQDFINTANAKLVDAGIDNATLHCMDAMESLPDGQFNAILVSGSMPRLEPRIVEMLRLGGRLFVVTGDAPIMSAQLVTLGDGEEWQSTALFETTLAPLQNVRATPQFSF